MIELAEPHAFILLIVMLHGAMLGDRAVPKPLHIAAVFLSVTIRILAPLLVHRLLMDRIQLEEAR